jgi:hypothetical protein
MSAGLKEHCRSGLSGDSTATVRGPPRPCACTACKRTPSCTVSNAEAKTAKEGEGLGGAPAYGSRCDQMVLSRESCSPPPPPPPPSQRELAPLHILEALVCGSA